MGNRKKEIHKEAHNVLSEPLYTVNEAAAQVRLSPWTIWDLLKKGQLMRTKVSGKTFVRQSELQKLMVDSVNEGSTHKRARKTGRVGK